MHFVRDAGLDQIGFSSASLLFQEVLGGDIKLGRAQPQVIPPLDGVQGVDVDCHLDGAAQGLADVPLVFVGALVVLQQVFQLLVQLSNHGKSLLFRSQRLLVLQVNYLLRNMFWVSPPHGLFHVEVIVGGDGALGSLLVEELPKTLRVSLDKHGTPLACLAQVLADQFVGEREVFEEHSAYLTVRQIALQTMFNALKVDYRFHLVGELLLSYLHIPLKLIPDHRFER